MPTQAPAGKPVRPAVLRLGSPAAVQFVLLVAAVLTTGLFAGNWLHDATSVGDAWLERVRVCWAGGPSGTAVTDQVEHQQRFDSCMAATERQRAAFAVGGMATAAVAAPVVLIVVPVVTVRRRHLGPLPPQLAPTAQRAAVLAQRMELSRPPPLLVGTSELRDAFSLGLPHRYRVVLPPKLAVSFRRPAVLDPVLAHELAHVARHDVTYAWAARTVWYAIVPVLAVPFLISAAQGDLSLAGDFLWRAVLLLGVVRLITARLLRVREYEADLTAARYLGVGPVAVGLDAAARRPERRGFRPALALHPTPAQRRSVLDDVSRLARPRFLDGLTAGFLAGAAAPLLLATFMTVLTGSGMLDLAHVATAALAGGALGVLVALVSWRAVLVDRLSATPAARWPLAVGVGAGLVLGDLVSLGQTATQGLVEPVISWWLLVTFVVGVGATALVYGLAELWADRAPGSRRAPRAVPALVGGVVVATALLLMLVARPVYGAGLLAVAAALASTRLGLLVALAMPGVAVVAAGWMRAARPAGLGPPAWLVEGSSPGWPVSPSPGLRWAVGFGLLAGLTGSAAIVGYRALVGPAPESLAETRYLHFLILGALVAGAAMLVVAVGRPRVGPGCGLVSAVVAALTVSAVVLLLNAVQGGSLDPSVIRRTVQATLGLALLLCLMAAGAGLVSGRAGAPHVLALLTVAASVVASLAVLRAAPGEPPRSEVRAYLQAAATLEADGSRLATTFVALTADVTSTGERNAERIRSEVLPIVDEMQAVASDAQPHDATLRAVHSLVLDSLDTAERAFVAMAEALDAYDPVAYEQGYALWLAANRTWARWRAAVTEAAGEAGQPAWSKASSNA